MSTNQYKGTVRYAGDDFFIGTTPSGHSQAIDTKGDRKSAASPLELLLISVAACTAVDVVSILEKKRQDVTDYNVEIEGSRREEFPKGFTAFHINHIVTGRSISEKAVADAIELSDTKYCSVALSLSKDIELTATYTIK